MREDIAQRHQETADTEMATKGPAVSRTTTVAQAVFNLSKSAVGTGALALPSAMKQLGLGLGLAVLVGASVMTTGTLHLLSRLAAVTEIPDYFRLGSLAYGAAGELSATIALILFLFGALILYVKTAGVHLVRFFVFVAGNPEAAKSAWYANTTIMMIVTAIVIFPLASMRDMSKLARTSLIGMLCMFYVIALVAVDWLVDAERRSAATIVIFNTNFTLAVFFEAFSIFLFSFVNHFTAVSNIPALINPTARRRTQVTLGSAAVVLVLYLVVSTAGYLHHGQAVGDNVLMEPRAACLEWAYAVAQILVAAVLIVSYPLLCDPTRAGVDQIISLCVGAKRRESESWRRSAGFRSTAITAVLLLLCTFIAATYCDNVTTILGVFTSLSGSLLVFIFPAIYFLRLQSKYKYRIHGWERILCFISIGFGLVLLVVGTYFNLTSTLARLLSAPAS